MKTSTAKKQQQPPDPQKPAKRNGVPFGIVNDFLNELQPLNSCLTELSILNDTGKQPATPALMSLLSGLYETATDRFIERAENSKALLVEEGGAA